MEAWIGPVILAALIAGLVNVAGWFVTLSNARQPERDRRLERMIDFQAALLAEIRSDYINLEQMDIDQVLAGVRERIDQSSNEYVPFVPRDAGIPIFSAVVGDISILPTDGIDSIVVDYKQREAIGHFAEDLRGARFAELPASLKIDVLRDYLQLRLHARALAEDAIRALSHSLGLPQTINRPASGPLDLKSASAGPPAASDHEKP